MKDLLTVITCMIGEKMERNNENTLFESLKINKNTGKDDWKIDIINEYIATHTSESISLLINKCVELAKDFNLGSPYIDEEYWKKTRENIISDIQKQKKKDAVNKAAKTIRTTASYGCGSGSVSYGCGGSNSYSSGRC